MASTTGQVLPDAKLERRTRRKFTDDEQAGAEGEGEGEEFVQVAA
ncbi:MAG: hypothetical protein U5R48_13540 [Gammaproteobacteria bacterium]|nr:hypothetical protein [Gammaproteobacteria bacterium]